MSFHSNLARRIPGAKTALKNMCLIAWLAALILISFAVPSAAQLYDQTPNAVYDPSADWCTDDLNFAPGDERFVPDGVIVQIGTHYFRICRSPLKSSTWQRRGMRFFYNPKRVPQLIFEGSMIGVKVTSLVSGANKTWAGRVNRSLDNHVKTRERVFGGITYQGYLYVDQLTQQTLGEEVYYFEGNRNADVPEHIFGCDEDPRTKRTELGSCYILVGYGTIQAFRQLFGGGSFARDLPIDSIPDLAQDIMRILKTADITDRLDEFSHLPVIR
ncbi:MAG: hypothetical protein AAGI36_03170 [Pseudomonadota bacterium]